MSYRNPEEFVGAVTLSFLRGGGGRIGPLLWANGVLFRHAPFVPTGSMTSEYLKGHLPLDNLEFAPMKQYIKELQHGDFIITIQDVSSNYVLNNLAKWILANLLEKKSKRK